MEDFSNSKISILFQVKKNQVNMLNDRGLKVPESEKKFLKKQIIVDYDTGETEVEEPDYTVNDFIKEYDEKTRRENISLYKALNNQYEDSNQDIVYVYYLETPLNSNEISKQQIDQVLPILNNYDRIERLILIAEVDSASKAKQELRKMRKDHVEFFSYDQLSFRPIDHEFNPKFTVLGKEEAREFFRKSKIKPSQLPVLRSDDPVAQYLGLRSGQVVKVDRSSLVEGQLVKGSIAYRLVRNTL